MCVSHSFKNDALRLTVYPIYLFLTRERYDFVFLYGVPFFIKYEKTK